MTDAEAEEERNLIKMLRTEAYDVKDCFTRYSIQGVVFVAIILTIIARFQGDFPEVAYASVVSVLVLFAVTRMGAHKYASVNRLNGYELHLQRTKALGESSRYEWTREMRKLGWEQAMRAWRVISPTVYDHLYNTPPRFDPQFGSQFRKLLFWMNPKTHLWRLHPHALREEFRDSTNRWFEPKSLFGN